jgi:hypothetical protein
MDDHTHSTDPKPPPIFISGVTNIKPLIELLNALAPNKYLVKTQPHDQAKVQPTESPVYTAIIKALMDRNTEFHTYKPKQDRSFRVVIKNLHRRQRHQTGLKGRRSRSDKHMECKAAQHKQTIAHSLR